MRRRELVRFSRRFEASKILGYVLGVGPQFFLLALISDRIWFDGFECFRINDVKDLRPRGLAAHEVQGVLVITTEGYPVA